MRDGRREDLQICKKVRDTGAGGAAGWERYDEYRVRGGAGGCAYAGSNCDGIRGGCCDSDGCSAYRYAACAHCDCHSAYAHIRIGGA